MSTSRFFNMKDITNKSLIKTCSYIDGAWSNNLSKFTVINPANEESIATIDDACESDAIRAVECAQNAFNNWRRITAAHRSALLSRWAKLITENEDDLARLLTLEQGKTISEALAEIHYGVSYLNWFSEEGKRVYGDTIPASSPQQRIIVTKQPVGVVTAITPWNFPNAMLLRKAAAALAAGCPFVIKPAPETPLSALALAHLADIAGLPSGTFNVVVSTKSSSIGKVLTQHQDVRKFSFTGSTAVGKKLLTQCAQGVKKVSMELGGNAPFIVFESADINEAIKGLIANKFRNSGQTCVSANRIFVQRTISKEFIKKLTIALENINVGQGLNKRSNIGPLISKKATDTISTLVKNALQEGAQLHFQSEMLNSHGYFFPVTLLTNVNNKMEIAQSEIFGPVISIIEFVNEEEVLVQANETNAGLAAYFYSQNFNQIWRASEYLDYGMIGVNEIALSNASAPFGGVKESGNGREGSHYGLDDYLELKYICIGGLS